jgi:predicted GNAT family acetyltransferase
MDNTALSRFETTVDGHLAELVYERHGDQLVLLHTEVPEALGGQGIGGLLVRAALEAAKRDGSAIVAECNFARTWLSKHPDETTGVRLAPIRSR